jgi:hypothetical protein
VLATMIMTRAIDLHDQSDRETREVGDVRTDRMLTPKSESTTSTASKQRPDETLRFRGFTPELTAVVSSVSHAHVCTGRLNRKSEVPRFFLDEG